MAKSTIKVVVSRLVGNHVKADKAKWDGEKVGKTTGLPLVHYVTALLDSNETAKANDDTLLATLQAEYPKRDGFQAIPTWRAYYNGSKHGMNEAGKHSTRYGEDGQPARKAKADKPAKSGKGKPAAKAASNGKASKGGAAKPAAKGSKGKAKAAKSEIAAA